MAINEQNEPQKKGRGWHSDSEGHRRAGRLGGLAKGRRAREGRTESEQDGRTEFTEA